MSNKEATKLKEKSTRVKRTRLKKSGPLYVDQTKLEEGYHYRIVNDAPGKINDRISMGYEIVEDKSVTVGDNSVTSSSRLGSAVVLDTGRSKEQKGVLMRIPVEDYEEILDELKEATDELDNGMYEELNKDREGTYYGGLKKGK